MFSADVASRMTHTEPVASDGVSNRSAKFLEHAANMSLWALKIVPERGKKKTKEFKIYCAICELFFSHAFVVFFRGPFASATEQKNIKTHFCRWP